MTYLLLGLVALIVVVLAMHGFTRANTAVLARNLRIAGGVILLSAAVALVFRGMVGHALPLAVIGWWLLAGQRGLPWSGKGGPQQSPGQSSRVATDYLQMELDHDTGEMRGRVLKGAFAGREIESLAPMEMAMLWRDCRFADPPSAQIVEVYLDRVHPSWREDLARERGESGGAHGHGAGSASGSGQMQVEEALEILGLEPGADEEQIRRAHRELMLKVHPDRGGSTYLAAKINEAKDVLVARSKE